MTLLLLHQVCRQALQHRAPPSLQPSAASAAAPSAAPYCATACCSCFTQSSRTLLHSCSCARSVSHFWLVLRCSSAHPYTACSTLAAVAVATSHLSLQGRCCKHIRCKRTFKHQVPAALTYTYVSHAFADMHECNNTACQKHQHGSGDGVDTYTVVNTGAAGFKQSWHICPRSSCAS